MKTIIYHTGLLSAGLLLCMSNLSFAQIDTVSKRSQATSMNTTISGSNSSMTGTNTQVNELSYSGVDVANYPVRNSSKPIAYKRNEKATAHHKTTRTKSSEPNK